MGPNKASNTYSPIIFCMWLAKKKTVTEYNCSSYCYLRSAQKCLSLILNSNDKNKTEKYCNKS